MSRRCQVVSMTINACWTFPKWLCCPTNLALSISRFTGSSVRQPAKHIGNTSVRSSAEIGSWRISWVMISMDWMISGTPANPSAKVPSFYALSSPLPGIGSLNIVCRYKSAASRYIFATSCAGMPGIPFKFGSSPTGRSGCSGV